MITVPAVRVSAQSPAEVGPRTGNPNAASKSPRPQRAASQRVHLNIGRMVLHDIPYHDHRRIRRALDMEFARLVQGSPNFDWHRVANLDRFKASDYPAGASAEQIGRHLAAEIFRSLKQ